MKSNGAIRRAADAVTFGKVQEAFPMRWFKSWRADPRAARLADAHYNRQRVGAAQFVPPGRCVVLRTETADAVWVTSWPRAEFVQHAWAGAWDNSLFRREPTAPLASELIREAVAATLDAFGPAPGLGMVTFVDASKTKRKRDPGRCYIRAGFKRVGATKGGLVALQMLPGDMPEPCAPNAEQLDLFDLFTRIQSLEAAQ